MSGMQRKDKVLSFWENYEPSLETMYLHEDASQIDEIERPEILALLPNIAGAQVLELAAGIGRFTGRFAELGAKHVTAVDMVEKFVDANRDANANFDNIDYICADATSLKYAPASFDLIFINWMMMYLEDHEMTALAARMSSWLKPNGHLFFRESCALARIDVDLGYYVHYREARDYTAAFSNLKLQRHSHIDAHARLLDNHNQLYWLYKRAPTAP